MNGPEVSHSLERIQHWMQAVIVHPGGVEAGIRSFAAREAIEIEPEELPGIIAPSNSLGSAERLGIYSSAYFARLLECLREEFPALRHAVGDNAFAAFVIGYLEKHPSESYTLAELGARFPQFLAETRPADDEPHPNWTDFVVELATVERIYAEVFDGPGIEQSRIIEPDDLTAIAAERWPDARLVPAPCLRLMELSYPVHEYITAVRTKQPARVPQPSPTWLAITRRDYVVRRAAISREEFNLLASLAAGRTVGEAMLGILQDSTGDADSLASDVQDWFRHWAAAGYFMSLSLP